MSLYVAKYAFEAQENGQVALAEGDKIELIEQDESGWWYGKIVGTDREGRFPYNYVEPAASPSPAGPALGASSSSLAGMSGVMDASTQQRASSGGTGTALLGRDRKYRQENTKEDPGAADKKIVHVPRPPKSAHPSMSKIKIAGLRDSKAPPVMRQTTKPVTAAPKDHKKDTLFRRQAHYIVKYPVAFSLPTLGLCAIIYGGYARDHDDKLPLFDVLFGIVGLLLGPALYLYEDHSGGKPVIKGVPLRGIVWFCTAWPFFFSLPMITCGLGFAGASIMDFIGFFIGEQWEAPRKKRKKKKTADLQNMGFFERQWETVEKWLKRELTDKPRRFSFCCFYFFVNLFLFVYTVVVWSSALDELEEEKKFSNWGPLAKGFGALIDLNSSLILFPVCRTVIWWLYNFTTTDRGCISSVLRTIFSFIAIDKNHLMHIQLAKISAFAAIGHTLMHFLNYAVKPDETLKVFGFGAFITGIIVLVSMMFIYTGALENIRRANFEMFFFSHHFYALYFCMILVHGRGWWNPNFWKYLLLPGTLYLFERIYRIVQGYRQVKLRSMMVMKPRLLCLEFDKQSAFGMRAFKEGQYVFVNCPTVRKYEWHPFTISSPPDKGTFTLHIQTQGDGSWTLGVHDYLLVLTNLHKTHGHYYEFESTDAEGNVQKGRVVGPDGKQLFLIDGPHSAPTQHMTEYNICMVAGAGIGLTPVAACMQSVVFHKWKFSVGKCFPSHAYFVWVVSYRDVKMYRWFACRLKEVQDCVVNMRRKSPESMKTKTFKFSIYITSVPKDLDKDEAFAHLREDGDEPGFWGRPAKESKVLTERASFTHEELYEAMLYPDFKKKTLGDIDIYTGRPVWQHQFEDIGNRHRGSDIGVMFCGNKFIASDLKRFCAKYTNEQNTFRLHKENF